MVCFVARTQALLPAGVKRKAKPAAPLRVAGWSHHKWTIAKTFGLDDATRQFTDDGYLSFRRILLYGLGRILARMSK